MKRRLFGIIVVLTALAVISCAGEPGEAGPQGSQGKAGVQGAAGPAGAQGAVGLQGAKGDTGPAGSAGATGVAGARGLPGPEGAKGAVGAAGIVGPVGPAGAAGARGAAGAVGAQGPRGADGGLAVTLFAFDGTTGNFGQVELGGFPTVDIVGAGFGAREIVTLVAGGKVIGTADPIITTASGEFYARGVRIDLKTGQVITISAQGQSSGKQGFGPAVGVDRVAPGEHDTATLTR